MGDVMMGQPGTYLLHSRNVNSKRPEEGGREGGCYSTGHQKPKNNPNLRGGRGGTKQLTLSSRFPLVFICPTKPATTSDVM